MGKTARRTKAKGTVIAGIVAVVVLLCIAAVVVDCFLFPLSDTQAGQKIRDYAEDHGHSYLDYPKSLIELLERNPETEQFVLEYPSAKDASYSIDLSGYSRNSVPLFLQWDQRWGYIQYGSDVAGLTGCGPVCLSMAAYYLTGNSAYSPDKMLKFASENGYYVEGSGSSWTLISEGGVKLGFDVTELPLDENRIRTNLEAGVPVICVMGPGDFTTSGHFIVLTGLEDGKFRVNDPNSIANSEKLWSYEQIAGQIKNLWAIRN
jgi:hypothetical protein